MNSRRNSSLGIPLGPTPSEKEKESTPEDQGIYRRDSNQSWPSRHSSRTSYISQSTSGSSDSIAWGLANPLAHIDRDELFMRIEAFAEEKGLLDIVDELKKGALVAQNPRSMSTSSQKSSLMCYLRLTLNIYSSWQL